MNYSKIYNLIIGKARDENRKKNQGIYYENHHIVPRCLAGDNSKENKVLLTAKEHFVCHKLLARIYPSNKKILYGFVAMSMSSKFHKRNHISAKDYEFLKSLMRDSMTGEGNSMFGKSIYDVWILKYGEEIADKKLSEYKEVISRKYSGVGNPRYGKNQSEKSKELICNKRKNTKASEETKKKHSENYKKIFGTKERREEYSEKFSGDKNPMYGRSAYGIWIEKYGIEEAEKRKAEANSKKSEFWKRRRLENDRITTKAS